MSLECSVKGCNYVTPDHINSTMEQIKLLEIHTTATELLGDDQLQCPECDFKSKSVLETLAHLGSVHDKVDQYLEEEFRIELRNWRRKEC